jgi:hypothetical protein
MVIFEDWIIFNIKPYRTKLICIDQYTSKLWISQPLLKSNKLIRLQLELFSFEFRGPNHADVEHVHLPTWLLQQASGPQRGRLLQTKVGWQKTTSIRKERGQKSGKYSTFSLFKSLFFFHFIYKILYSLLKI